MTYDNNMKGILFNNDKKEKDTHPDFKGSLTVDGKEYWVSGWNKDTSKGPAISLSVQEKEVKAKPAPKPHSEVEDLDDDIPF
jgi:hypothetical protein